MIGKQGIPITGQAAQGRVENIHHIEAAGKRLEERAVFHAHIGHAVNIADQNRGNAQSAILHPVISYDAKKLRGAIGAVKPMFRTASAPNPTAPLVAWNATITFIQTWLPSKPFIKHL
jgi:hypothetical protein